ncbi:MAG: hypothetical protein JWQ07_5794 [Ramlibacter sp.]|nr:hypothetical protein [Ramlibacter sp.]
MASKHVIAEMRPVELTLEEELGTLDEADVSDMANLGPRQTGIDGVVFISTNFPKLPHGPRVKYFLKAGKTQPSFSLSIEADPQIVASSLPDRVVRRVAPMLTRWVKLNREALIRFWNDGDRWMDDEVTAFKLALLPVPE